MLRIQSFRGLQNNKTLKPCNVRAFQAQVLETYKITKLSNLFERCKYSFIVLEAYKITKLSNFRLVYPLRAFVLETYKITKLSNCRY